MGEMDGQATPRVQLIYETLRETGVTVELSENIMKILWTKLVFISAISSLGSLTRLPIGEYRVVTETRVMMISLMEEIVSVALAQKVNLDQDVIQKSLDFIDKAAPHIKTSMQLDVEAGRQSELESIVGVIGRKSRDLGIPTPTADTVSYTHLTLPTTPYV